MPVLSFFASSRRVGCLLHLSCHGGWGGLLAAKLLPVRRGFVILAEHGDAEPVGLQAEFLRDQVPGQLDRAFLEVVAEREVAQHLEEGVVACGVADVLEVVVLAAGAYALLRRGGTRIGALLEAREDVLELHHSGVGEHQRGIVARHQRARIDDLVAVGAEVF